MVSEVKKRTIDEIKQAYSDLCAKAGHLQYQIHTHSKDLALVNDELRELNFEAAKLVAETPKAAE